MCIRDRYQRRVRENKPSHMAPRTCQRPATGWLLAVAVLMGAQSAHGIPAPEQGQNLPPLTYRRQLADDASSQICHYPTESPGTMETLTVPASSWPEHQRHGDTLGACPTPPPTVAPTNEPCAGITLASNEDFCPALVASDWHESIEVAASACNMHARTRRGNCLDWCAAKGLVCVHAQDNIGNSCNLDTRHVRQTNAGNGCSQNWNNQVCGCRPGTSVPTQQPTSQPTTAQPTAQPTGSPTSLPTSIPTTAPSAEPTAQPTGQPTDVPTQAPTAQPTSQPTPQPTERPCADGTHGCDANTGGICVVDGASFKCACEPAYSCTANCATPQSPRVCELTAAPTSQPTQLPTAVPTVEPTELPSVAPTTQPTAVPSAAPTAQPTDTPTLVPTGMPSTEPTFEPTFEPTEIERIPSRGRAPVCSAVVGAPDHSCTHTCAMFSMECSVPALAACSPEVYSKTAMTGFMNTLTLPDCVDASADWGNATDVPNFEPGNHCYVSDQIRSDESYSCDRVPDTGGLLLGKRRMCFCDAPVAAARVQANGVERYSVSMSYNLDFDTPLTDTLATFACVVVVDLLEANHAPFKFTCALTEANSGGATRSSGARYTVTATGDTSSSDMTYERLAGWSSHFDAICGDQTSTMGAGVQAAFAGTGTGMLSMSQASCHSTSDGEGAALSLYAVVGVSVGCLLMVIAGVFAWRRQAALGSSDADIGELRTSEEKGQQPPQGQTTDIMLDTVKRIGTELRVITNYKSQPSSRRNSISPKGSPMESRSLSPMTPLRVAALQRRASQGARRASQVEKDDANLLEDDDDLEFPVYEDDEMTLPDIDDFLDGECQA
eukprot:TRINITY_DN1223_c0_g1_i2.p1 TRINITY_DN1223_c0_g1~~TRINITY_DN1223_c0_g1_i2.p1  ORF type:complete len:835 (-),score=66.63 TRINITY_DN1223_c0_g1_i2:193-2697(-)